jgi:hypothetical protein
MKKIIISLSIFSFFILNTGVCFSEIEQKLPEVKINPPKANLPQTIGEAEEIGIDFLNFLPGEMKKGWKNAVVIWINMYRYSINLFNRYIKSHIIIAWNKLSYKSKKKLDESNESLKKELIKEKEGMKESIEEKSERTTKSLWQLIKDRFKIDKK